MFKLICFLNRRVGMTPAEMREHYENVHVPLARKTFPQIVEHRRNWPEEGGAFFAEGYAAPACDCISEIWFEDRAGFDAMLALLADPEASAEIKADEVLFLDPSRCGMMVVDETIALGARR